MRAINAKRLSQLVRKLAAVPSQASAQIARELNAEIQGNFDKGVDPFGRRWKRLAKSTLAKGRHPPPLTDTRRGRESVTAKSMRGAGVMIVVGVLYMIYHQFGGKSHLRGHRKNKNFGRDKDRSSGRATPPRRSFLPQGNEWPKRWIAIIDRAYTNASLKVWNRG